MKSYLCVCVCFLLNASVWSQEIRFTQPLQSLSQNTIHTISQDQLGFIWVGTENGLNRYDGEHFEVFYQDSNSYLDISTISTLFNDKKGDIWIGTYGGGVSLYSPSKQAFINHEIDPGLRQALSQTFVQAIYESNDSTLWFGTESSGIKIWDRKKKELSQLISGGRLGMSLSSNLITGIVEDSLGNIWISTFGGGLCNYNRVTKFISFYSQQEGYDIPEDGVIRLIHKSFSNNIWVGTNKGIRKLNVTDGSKTEIDNLANKYPRLQKELKETVILSLLEDTRSRLWIGTENRGLFMLDLKSGQFKNYMNDVRNTYSLNSNSIWSLFEDVDGTIWIGSYKGGICKIDPFESRFRHISESSGEKSSISRSLVSAFAEDQEGNMWIGTEGGGVDLMSPNENIRNVSRKEIPGLSNDIIVDLKVDEANNLWVATWGDGVFLKKAGKNRFDKISDLYPGREELPGRFIRSMYKSRNGELWFSSYRTGLNLYVPQEDKFYTYDAGASLNRVSGNNMNAIVEDQTGAIWIGYRNRGLDRITFDENRNIIEVKNYSSLSNNSSLKIYNNITYLFIDSDNQVWIGYSGGGLAKLDTTQTVVEQISANEGLPGDVIYGILEDETGRLWVSTNNGLASLNREAPYEIKTYDSFDGLQDKEFTLGACLRRKDNTLVFGGINGFNYFKQGEIQENKVIAPLYITALEIEAFNADQKKREIQKIQFPHEKITLKADQNDLQFEFATLNFSQAHKNTYTYKLEPLDEDWKSPSSSNFIRYLNIPPGDYTFLLKAENSDGLGDKEPISLDIRILYPWYWTLIARLIYICLGLGLLIFIYNMLINREKLKNQLQLEYLEQNKVKELSEIKSRFFANISHEFKTPLTLIKSPLLELMDMKHLEPFKGHLNLIKKNTDRLRSLIDEILELSKVESGSASLDRGVHDLGFFLRSVLDYFYDYAQQRKVKLEHEIPNEEIAFSFDAGKLEKVFFNILSNAFKFTPAGGRILFKLRVEPDYLQIDISDTGSGIEKERIPYIFDMYNSANNPDHLLGIGIGLNLAKQYVELHKGKIWVESELGKGSIFSIQFPRDQELELTGETPYQTHLSHPEEETNALSDLSDFRVGKNGDSLQKPLILIAEDNDEIRDFLCNILKQDYRIIQCNDGLEAFEQAILSIPDLILSDVVMPEMDGYQLCKKIRTNEKTCHVLFFILSVKANEGDVGEGLYRGADQYIAKPFNPQHLKLLIKNAIGKRNEFKNKLLSQKILSLDSENVIVNAKDNEFLSKVVAIIEKNLSNSDFSVEELCHKLGYSKSQLYRKMKALLGQSANEFIRSLRLKRAAALIEQKAYTITEITYKVGFVDLPYFRKCFKKQFGINPSEYEKQKELPDN